MNQPKLNNGPCLTHTHINSGNHDNNNSSVKAEAVTVRSCVDPNTKGAGQGRTAAMGYRR